MSGKVKVIEQSSQEVLFECEIHEMERAYNYAEQMEEIGLDVKIEAPSAPETLARSLGSSEETISSLKAEIQKEIEDHDIEGQFESCTFCEPDNDNKH
jgi:hypothetical protein